MESNPLITVSSSTIPTSHPFNPPIEAQRAAFKSYIITEYCEGRAPAEIVDAAFEALPELRSA